MAAEPLPIAEFVERRRREIGLGKADVVRRCGYRNLSKGLRRLDALYAGDVEGVAPAAIIRRLSEALKVDQETVDAIVSATKEIVHVRMHIAAAARKASWRDTFKPHAYFVTERTIPTQITICALTGGGRSLAADCSRHDASASDFRGASTRRRKEREYRPVLRGHHRSDRELLTGSRGLL
jgi:hypothetical protein